MLHLLVDSTVVLTIKYFLSLLVVIKKIILLLQLLSRDGKNIEKQHEQ